MEQTPTSLDLSFATEVDAVQNVEEREIVVMVSLLAPHFEANERAPLDLVCVIDRSGSMSGPKLQLSKETLNFTIRQLQAKDRLAIVSYDHAVAVDLGLTQMDQKGKELAVTAVAKIRAGGSTDLCAGMLKGLELVKETGESLSSVSSVLLMTDGCANAGIQKSEEIIKELQKHRENSSSTTLHTFGYGGDHDVTMLKAISDEAMGVYYFIENQDQIPEAFGDCIGGLLSVVGQNVSVCVEGVDGSKITQVMTGFKTEKSGESSTVHLGDLQSEEGRDILCKVSLPSCEAGSANIIKATISYFNVLESIQVDIEQIITINRPDQLTEAVTCNPKIDQQKNRLLTAEVLIKAKQLADQGSLEPARELVRSTIKRIQESPSGNEIYCQGLLVDLQDCLSGMKDKQMYTTSGCYSISSKASSHTQQRATTSTKSYSTTSKTATRNNFK